ncbi:AraC family transcriptional regulator [Herbaspirillum sp. WKF16]|jgi:AraC-like DNA-binding protein|uniref:AraC family transcriptional regulator n=1 Tax=Herbaspirillum sp. WKF16 TaxID=3028312 RepID=UPI0023A92171|nr:AraC family transcriptional regulator [Herbaspirillum sp. WKF16]WDZ95791.1 AraC family transcriptional regulator [Herbaspirillum sp. WKF16]
MTKLYTRHVDRLIQGARTRYALPTSLAETGIALVQHQHFSVNDESRALQARAWSDYVGRILDTPVSRAQTLSGFYGEIDSYVLKDMIYLDVRTDPLHQARTGARISRDNVRDFVFHIAVEGVMETVTASSRHGAAAQFVPGVLALDMGQTMRMHRPTRARVLAFFTPRERVAAVIADPESIHGRILSYASPLGQLIQAQVRHLTQRLPFLDQRSAQEAIGLCLDLILTAFAKQVRLDDGARAVARQALMACVKRHIMANLHKKELSAMTVQRAFPQVPRPTLYRMFEPEGGLAAYIRNCRLWAAARELIELRQMPVAEIAYGLGFGSASDFSRAFKRSYDVSPLDFRAAGEHWLL